MSNRLPERSKTKSPPSICTDGLEFVEFTATDIQSLEHSLTQLGFHCVADHRHKDVRLYRQNEINFIVNAEAESLASQYAENHGPSSNALAFRVNNVNEALAIAKRQNLNIIESTAGPMELTIPAIRYGEDSLIYLVDRYGAESIYDIDFVYRNTAERYPKGLFTHVDHVTQNVRQGELQTHVDFYRTAFAFHKLQTFDIRGKHSGLASEALISKCGKIKIPINEPTDRNSQIAEFIADHRGNGVQHIALATSDIYQAVRTCLRRQIAFQSTPASYYESIAERVGAHNEDLSKLKRLNILIDGDARAGILLQIFTQIMIGSLFFEIIQRKGNNGFGEGNFQALFESIEREQAERGYFNEAI